MVEIVLDRFMPVQESDIDLVRRVAAGDEEALRRLYAEYGQRLYAYALRLTGSPAAADEVVQEALVAAWQGAKRFRPDGRVITWLLGIAHHKALDLLRKREPELLGDGDGELRTHDPQPDAQAALSEQRRMVRQGLQALSLEHRMVLELVFYQELSLNEAAEVLGCPVGTVKSRLSYAKAGLRGALHRAGLHAEDVDL